MYRSSIAPRNRSPRSAITSRIEDRAIPRGEHGADRAREADFVRRERPPAGRAGCAGSEPPHRQLGRVGRRLDREPAIGRNRRRGLALERRAREETAAALPAAGCRRARRRQRQAEAPSAMIVAYWWRTASAVRTICAATRSSISSTASPGSTGRSSSHDDGYRVRTYSYAQVAALARAFAERLREPRRRPG